MWSIKHIYLTYYLAYIQAVHICPIYYSYGGMALKMMTRRSDLKKMYSMTDLTDAIEKLKNVLDEIS